MAIKVGINGFGRIGRKILRAALESKNSKFDIVHINDLTDNKTLAHLMKYDSVHGTLGENIKADGESALFVGDRRITTSAIRSPAELPWKELGVEMVFECTGIFKSREAVSEHLKAGAKKVLISAPAKGEDITIVYGVNDADLDPAKHNIVSNGSCTTNCLAPVAKVIQENFGIEHGLMTTIHAYTNDQRILDLPHSDLRRARAAALSMIPTTTGAAKAIALVMPELKGKMDGMAIRVPTPNVSCVDVTFQLKKDTTADEVNAALKKASETTLKGVLGFCEEPLVSIDYNGDSRSSIVDALSTKVLGGKTLKILSWYDNESGFSWRMLDVAAKMV